MSGEADKIGVAVVDDEADVRFLLADMLKWSGDMKCVGAFASGEVMLGAVELVKPEMVMMDICLPGMSGIECARRLKNLDPQLRVIFVTGLADAATLNEAINAGGDDYLIKPFVLKQCLATLRVAVVRHRRLADTVSARRCLLLTEQEERVMQCLERGLLYKEIASELGISYAAVNKHQHNIFIKLNVANRTEAMICRRKQEIGEAGARWSIGAFAEH